MTRTLIIATAALMSLPVLAQTAEDITFRKYVDIVLRSSRKLKSLNEDQRAKVLSHVINHPVASTLDPQTIKKYDPQGLVGFCFGRAMAVHLAARKIGLENGSIRKVFIIGDMRSGSQPEWRFHVTTIVKGDDGEWYALDPIAAWGTRPRIFTVERWAHWVRSIWDRPGSGSKTMLYLVAPDFIVPNLLVVPPIGAQNQTDIMSTTFNPSTKASYTTLQGPERLFAMTFSEQLKQFIGAFEGKDKRFDFTSITVNANEPYSYNGYFHDLLAVFSDTSEEEILGEANTKRILTKRSPQTLYRGARAFRERNALGSPLFRSR